MAIRMGAREARQRFSEMIGRVHYGGETVILESSGKPMAAVVPLEVYNRIMAEREARFRVLDEIHARVPQLPEEEVETDVAEALGAVRGRRDPRRS